MRVMHTSSAAAGRRRREQFSVPRQRRGGGGDGSDVARGTTVHTSTGRRDRFPAPVHISTGRRDRNPNPGHINTGWRDRLPTSGHRSAGRWDRCPRRTECVPLPCAPQHRAEGQRSPPMCTHTRQSSRNMRRAGEVAVTAKSSLAQSGAGGVAVKVKRGGGGGVTAR